MRSQLSSFHPYSRVRTDVIDFHQRPNHLFDGCTTVEGASGAKPRVTDQMKPGKTISCGYSLAPVSFRSFLDPRLRTPRHDDEGTED